MVSDSCGSAQNRTDKYEPDVIEYWTDVLTTGEMIFRKSELHVREYSWADRGRLSDAYI